MQCFVVAVGLWAYTLAGCGPAWLPWEPVPDYQRPAVCPAPLAACEGIPTTWAGRAIVRVFIGCGEPPAADHTPARNP